VPGFRITDVSHSGRKTDCLVAPVELTGQQNADYTRTVC
jgi:hypothetical protein